MNLPLKRMLLRVEIAVEEVVGGALVRMMNDNNV